MARAPEMTEPIWLAHTWDRVHPPRHGLLVDFLQARSSPRKMRLFGCACVRAVDKSEYPQIVEAERFADGKIDVAQLEISRRHAYDALADFEIARDFGDGGPIDDSDPRVIALRAVCGLLHLDMALSLPGVLRDPFPYRRLLHEVFGNPFQPVTIAPEWLAWNHGLVRQMAEGIYEDRRFDECPILADALAEAGCEVPALVDHLRDSGEHVRGCWVLDAILGLA
jgi:hypothetical protein